jgi:hypothetical protein
VVTVLGTGSDAPVYEFLRMAQLVDAKIDVSFLGGALYDIQIFPWGKDHIMEAWTPHKRRRKDGKEEEMDSGRN